MTTLMHTPSGFEIATGMVVGTDEPLKPLPEPSGAAPLNALEHEILPALLRPPCLVSFSGGRDSSAVLATAAALARREGLALPIPATNVFRAAPETDERSWQEQVVRHLGITEWLKLEHTDELDVIGPYAQRVLRRHGLVWPFNLHFHQPLLDAARGGSLLTGVGGDELFGAARRDPVAELLSRRRRPRPRDLLSVSLAIAPHVVRRAVLAHRAPLAFPWLRRSAQRSVATAVAGWSASQPWSLRERLTWLRSARYLNVLTAMFALTANDANVLLVHPLLSPQAWSDLGALGEPCGLPSRTEAMRRTFGDLLPDAICARGSKARFDDVFWTARARAYANSWDGCGTPEDWVDPAALHDHWQGEDPRANSFTLLQAVWLASAERGEQLAYDLVGKVPTTRPLEFNHRQGAELNQPLRAGRI